LVHDLVDEPASTSPEHALTVLRRTGGILTCLTACLPDLQATAAP
jgi:hypothetical protein